MESSPEEKNVIGEELEGERMRSEKKRKRQLNWRIGG